jgi:ABC-2 type transport system permease protein
MSAARALARQAFRDARTRTITFVALFLIYAYVQPVGYRTSYPTLADRLSFAHGLGDNKALRVLYGWPRAIETVGGYSAWRVGGTLAIAAAAFGVLAAVRAMRTEEDTGRAELVLASPVGRRTVYLSALAAIGAGVFLLWLGEWLGFVAGKLPVGDSAYLALATASVAPVFVGIGAVASQLSPTRRVALEVGGAAVALSFVLRVVADTTSAGWMRWLTPLGWAEELRPFAGARPAVLLLPAVSTAVLLVVAWRICVVRDVGTGLLPARDTADPDPRLLSSPGTQALRAERGSLVAWILGVGAFCFILGMVSKSISSSIVSESVRKEIAKLGTGSILTPTGYLSFVFIVVILVVSLFACAQVAAARHEEDEQRLETLFALPVGRVGWLRGRLVLAMAGAVVLAFSAGVLTWAGAAVVGAPVALVRMLEAAANTLPVALVFLGLAALAYALVPRASSAIAYALVTVAYLWQLVGALLGAPSWLRDLTPFAHVGFVPAQPFRGGAALVMVAIGVACALVAAGAFRRRDLLGA